VSALTLDAEALYADLRRGVQTLLAERSGQTVHLVGVASGGVWLAERIGRDLGLSHPLGVLSSSMHRDDFSKRGLSGTAQTQLPFDVEGAHLIVLDDVLYTGRTVRAVLNELFDYGRPASVKLAVLVDRGGRELPVQADVAAARLHLPADQSLQLARDAAGRLCLEVQGA
jgi:pyrimidine operon attenuation protein/uracil phosphoribosyltransferase